MTIELTEKNLTAKCCTSVDLTDTDKLKLLRMFRENPSLFLKDFTTLLDGRLIKIIPDV
jgi:hypothetical protein